MEDDYIDPIMWNEMHLLDYVGCAEIQVMSNKGIVSEMCACDAHWNGMISADGLWRFVD